MLPWILLASAQTPDGATIRLFRRGEEFSIRLADGNGLMSSHLSGSEEALATLALDHLAPQTAPRVLIGGLGMGFTLRAAQGILGSDARLVVAEIVPELASWASDHMAPVFGTCLTDPRVEIVVSDVGVLIHAAHGSYDAILLDVDNGPDGLTRPGNDALYSKAGLRAAGRALRPGGILAVWSAAPDRAFAERLSGAGFETTTSTVRAGRGKRGAKHTIWLGRRPGR